MGKLDELMRSAGASIRESSSHRGTPAAMPGAAAIVSAPGADRDAGVVRSKVSQVIQLDRIVRDPDQPREEFEPEPLQRLADSLRDQGLLQPIAVRWDEGQGAYVVVVGERRWRAARMAGLVSIPCTVLDREYAPGELLALQVLENVLREDLRPVEQAKAYRTLQEVHGWSGHRLAKELGVSQAAIVQSLSLLKLPDAVQDAVEQGGLSPTVAYEVGKLEDPAEQVELAQAVADQRLTRSEVAEAVRSIRAKRPSPAAKPAPVDLDLGDGVIVKIVYRKASAVSPAQALRRAAKMLQDRERAGEADAA